MTHMIIILFFTDVIIIKWKKSCFHFQIFIRRKIIFFIVSNFQLLFIIVQISK